MGAAAAPLEQSRAEQRPEQWRPEEWAGSLTRAAEGKALGEQASRRRGLKEHSVSAEKQVHFCWGVDRGR